MTSPDIDRLFRAKSVALIGVSANPRRLNGIPLRILLRSRFAGDVFLVNPKYREIEGIACYADVDRLPFGIDAALIMVPAAQVPDVVAACGRKGIGAAVVLSSGFEEAADGHDLADRLRLAAAEAGVALIGPNCEGVWSVANRVVLTFGSAANRDVMVHAPIAIVSQSGAIGGSIGRHLQDGGIGCAYLISVGNETQLSACDIVAWLIEQDDVKVVLLFLEGLRDGSRLVKLARRARRRGIQLVALKSGNSPLGQQAAASHTGKIATPYAVYRDVFEQAGILQVHSVVELIEAAEVFSYLPALPPNPGSDAGLSIFSIPGGTRALSADLAFACGLPLARFDPQTVARLQAMLPRFGSATNPTDVTGQVLSDPDLFDRTLRRVVEDPNTESLIIQFANRGPDDARARAELLAKTIAPRRLPTVISFLADVLPAAERRRFAEQGLVCARDPADAVRYIDWLYRRRRADLPVSEPAQGRLDAAFVLADVRSWPDLMGLLASAGIRTPAWSIIGPAQNPDEAVAGLAFPLAVKALPEDADHKTEHGLVRLRLRDAAEVRDAVAAVRARLGRPAPVLAQEMVSGVEAVVAVLQDPDFGPVLAIGTGGVGVELFQDIGYLSLPAAASEVRGLIARLRLGRLLAGFRGAPAGDTEALVVAALALADLFQAARGRWAELEVNPLIVLPTGEGAVAVDILIKPASAATVA